MQYKMITNSRGKDLSTKQEGNSNNDNNDKITKGPAASSRSSWSGLKDPRVVRVSRTFGGKDRHSKVCTVRGLRDRRVRLSVPTAIQLYDLQDRLGLNQPSKVVDWLLNAAKDEIDELPPLQIPPGAFGLYPQHMIVSPQEVNDHMQTSLASLVDSYVKDGDATNLLRSDKAGFKINDNSEKHEGSHQTTETASESKYWNLNSPMRSSKSKELVHETTTSDQRNNWMMNSKRSIHEQQGHNQENGEAAHNTQVGSSHHHPLHNPARANLTSLSGFQSNNNVMVPQSSFYHWDPSNLSLSQLGNQGSGFSTSSQTSEDPHNFNILSMGSSSHLPTLPPGSHHQLLVCPSGATPPFFQPYATSLAQMESGAQSRQIHNHFQMLSSSSSAGNLHQNNLQLNSLTPSLYSISPAGNPSSMMMMRPLQLGVNSSHPGSSKQQLLHSQNNNGGGSDNDNDHQTNKQGNNLITTNGLSSSFTSSYSFQNDQN